MTSTKTLLARGLASGLVLALSACGQDSQAAAGNDSSSGAPAKAAPAAAGEAVTPVTPTPELELAAAQPAETAAPAATEAAPAAEAPAAGDAAGAAADAPAADAPAPGGKSTVQLTDETQRRSYVLGAQTGNELQQRLKQLGFEIDLQIFLAAMADVVNQRELAMTDEELMQEIQGLQEQFRAQQMERVQEQKAAAETNAKVEQEFLKENATKEGVKTTESGLQYKVVQEGEGPKPKATDTVKVDYRGTLIDGTVFDESDEPITFQLNGVIQGWTEGVQLMSKGAKYQFFIPSKLAYGERGRPGIEPNAMLTFDIELVDIIPAEAGAEAPQEGETVTIQ
jgi:FKBP-type peptidyl-prolyl cis-trans isomerase